MLSICSTCEEVFYRGYRVCPSCSTGRVLSYELYLDLDLRYNVGGVSRKITLIQYQDLVLIFNLSNPLLANRQLYHTVRYWLGVLEYREVNKVLDLDLPLYINMEWVTDVGREAYEGRLSNEVLREPTKLDYSERYFDDRDLS